MARWATFYEVDASARDKLAGLGSGAEWYRVLGMLRLLDAPSLDAEQSLGLWWAVLEEQPYPLCVLDEGDFHADYDGNGDLHLAFLGPELVKELTASLASHGREFFAALLARRDPDARHGWLYEPLRDFLARAAAHGSAVIVVRERDG
jgi:hypothetical protein